MFCVFVILRFRGTFVYILTQMAKRYILLLCIWTLGIIQAFAQTGCLYNGDIFTGGSISNPGADNYGYYSSYTVLTNQCASSTQIPCRVYYWTGINDYYPGVKSDYSSLNCPIDGGTLGLLLCSGMFACFMICRNRRIFGC